MIPARRNSRLYDVTLRAEEEVNLYKMLDEGRISREELNRRLERAGRILLVSSMDAKPEEIFLMYKQRCSVEKAFDAYYLFLHADRMYLQSDEAVFRAHLRIFLSPLRLLQAPANA